MNRLLSIAATALTLALSTSAFANSHKEAPMLTNVAASAPMTAQQSKMGDCNKQATKGDDRKAFMKSCLSAGGASAPATPMTQQEKMKKCNADATGKKGDDRKAFMKTCLSA